MNRRSFIRGMGASAMLASLPSFTHAEECLPTPPSEQPNYWWTFIHDLGWDNNLVIVERYWLGNGDAANKAVFGDEPFEAQHSLIEKSQPSTTKTVYPDQTRSWDAVLWGEDVKVVQHHVANVAFVWVVTADVAAPQDGVDMVIRSVVELGEPRAPRDWFESAERGLID